MTHRLLPASPDSLIDGVGPAELDFEFVKLGLQRWPWTNGLLYVGLIACVALHMIDGTNIILRSRKRRSTITFAGLVLPVLTGLYVVSQEPLRVFSDVAKRFEAVFRSARIYFV